MFTKKLFFAVSLSAILASQSANAVIGPIKITLNNEYRTSTPVIGSIATSIKLDKSDIKKTGASTFVELLESIPSISFEGGTGNMASVRLRGNEIVRLGLLPFFYSVDFAIALLKLSELSRSHPINSVSNTNSTP